MALVHRVVADRGAGLVGDQHVIVELAVPVKILEADKNIVMVQPGSRVDQLPEILLVTPSRWSSHTVRNSWYRVEPRPGWRTAE